MSLFIYKLPKWLQEEYSKKFKKRLIYGYVGREVVRNVIVVWDEKTKRKECALINPKTSIIELLIRESVNQNKDLLSELLFKEIKAAEEEIESIEKKQKEEV